jgi:hypothetical protein
MEPLLGPPLATTVFGTYFLPRDRRPPVDIGVADMPAFPQDYWGQILSPLRWKSLRPAG